MAKPIGPAILKEKDIMVYHKTELDEDIELERLDLLARRQRIYAKIMQK